MSTQAIAKRTDLQIQEDVLDELRWDSRIGASEVSVSVKEGVVTLTGMVDAYLKKWAVGEAALRVLGVKAVANDVVVKLHSTTERTDPEVAQAGVNALTWDAEVPNHQIHVIVQNGWVTLTGEVDAPFQRGAAERTVRHLAGVLGVSNSLIVRQGVPAPNDVQERIERALVRNAAIDAGHITVAVHGHKVLLKGTVRSHAERSAAERAAHSAPSIAEVDNCILIEQ